MERQEVLVDRVQLAVEGLLERRRAVSEGGCRAVVEPSDLVGVTLGKTR